ncbi:MAG: prepilin-type N-terminal cleavage/methylation domain-containing protein [Verrucomicrobia bacterium]|nr:MAG: prepilin-type N-terminal cleavage/methylation domain-containing protein [Verrucomicrobiota bacterium]
MRASVKPSLLRPLVGIDSAPFERYTGVMQSPPRVHRHRAVHHISSSPFAAMSHGFTLIELLVVLAIMAILIVIAFPAFDRPRPNHPIHCLSNTKQLMLGWIMYADDNQGALIANEPYAGGTAGTNNWIGGVMDWSANPQNTNADFLHTNRLGDYVKSVAAYRCPADNSVSAAGPRIRSYAMNGFMNGGSNRVTSTGWKQFTKKSEIRRPADTFVIVDEHANSIDDGYFFNDPNQTNSWKSLPAANHNGAAGFSFADGHSEIHKWVDRSTKQTVVPGRPKPVVTIAPRKTALDLAWVLERTTYPHTNSVVVP